jgi:hypothetical protein
MPARRIVRPTSAIIANIRPLFEGIPPKSEFQELGG